MRLSSIIQLLVFVRDLITRIAGKYNPCWHPNSGRSPRHVLKDNSVCSNQGVVPNFHTPEYFSTSPDVHVSSQNRSPGPGATYPYRHLLEYLTVGSDN